DDPGLDTVVVLLQPLGEAAHFGRQILVPDRTPTAQDLLDTLNDPTHKELRLVFEHDLVQVVHDGATPLHGPLPHHYLQPAHDTAGLVADNRSLVGAHDHECLALVGKNLLVLRIDVQCVSGNDHLEGVFAPGPAHIDLTHRQEGLVHDVLQVVLSVELGQVHRSVVGPALVVLAVNVVEHFHQHGLTHTSVADPPADQVILVAHERHCAVLLDDLSRLEVGQRTSKVAAKLAVQRNRFGHELLLGTQPQVDISAVLDPVLGVWRFHPGPVGGDVEIAVLER